jgi:hypothetical protein
MDQRIAGRRRAIEYRRSLQKQIKVTVKNLIVEVGNSVYAL